MGACDIEFERQGKLSQNEIYDAFKNQQDIDRRENGSRSGYSGDFQTVHKVLTHYKTFATYSEAKDYCLENAEKWTSVVAVYYFDGQVKPSKTIAKLESQITALSATLRDLEATPLDRSKPFQTCKSCKSRLSLAHVKRSSCPVCQADLRPERLKRLIETAKQKLATVKAKLDATQKIENEKRLPRLSRLNLRHWWLVGERVSLFSKTAQVFNRLNR